MERPDQIEPIVNIRNCEPTNNRRVSVKQGSAVLFQSEDDHYFITAPDAPRLSDNFPLNIPKGGSNVLHIKGDAYRQKPYIYVINNSEGPCISRRPGGETNGDPEIIVENGAEDSSYDR